MQLGFPVELQNVFYQLQKIIHWTVFKLCLFLMEKQQSIDVHIQFLNWHCSRNSWSNI